MCSVAPVCSWKVSEQMASAGQDEPSPTYPIGSVDSALRLLLIICGRQQLRVAEASEELGVARSTAYRLLQMLQFHGFVRQDQSSKAYVAGPVLFDMGLQIVRNLDIRSHARHFLEDAQQASEETVQLYALQHDGLLACIDAVESPRPVRVGGNVGAMVGAFTSAPGRAVLALMSSTQVADVQRRSTSRSAGSRSLASIDRDLKAAREHGYAVQMGEEETGVSAVASAIADGRGNAAFAVMIAVPSSRFDVDAARRLGRIVHDCASSISVALPW